MGTTYTFKTNLKCKNCVAKIKPQLDRVEQIEKWSVDQRGNDSMLSVDMEGGEPSVIEKILLGAGYKAEFYSKKEDK